MLSKTEEIAKTTPSKIFFWEGLFDPQDLAQNYEPIVEKLLDGNYQGLDLEKLDGYNVYSVRVNQSNRLLFTTIRVNNKPYLLLLDEVLNHDYAKSRFLKRGVLKHYLELNGKIFSEEISRAHFKPTDKAPAAPTENRKNNKSLNYSRIDFFNQKFIELDPLQFGIATKTKLPLIISGAAGSGKSCVGLSILANYVESFADDKYPILYVTESEHLANHMRQAWLALPIAQGLDAKAVQFKSYQQLIIELEPKTANMTFVDKDKCQEWLTSYIKLHQKLAKVKGNALGDEFYADINKMYQELRIISGCQSLEEYKILGQKQSLYTNPNEKEWLYAAYTVYQKKLENSNSIHAPFYKLPKQNQFKRIVVDEAQDFSHLQLQALADLACDKQICYCEDNRQSLSDNKSKVPFLEKLFKDWNVEENHISLPVSYRCPAAAILMANATAELKAMATDYGQPEIQIPPGQVQGAVKWFDSLDAARLLELQQLASSPDFAVVTTKEYKKEAKLLFKTLLVFTPEKIKGLEYKNIMAYRLLDKPLFKEADKVIGEKALSFSKKSDNRAKKDQGKEHLGPPFNAFYTACTRTTDTLYVFQENHHNLKNIITHLKKAIPTEPNKSLETTLLPILNPEQLSNDWFEQGKVLLGQGNVGKAEEILLGLGKTEKEVEELKREFLQPVEHDSVVDRSVHDNKLTVLQKSVEDQIKHTDNLLEKMDKIIEDVSEYKILTEEELKAPNHSAKRDNPKPQTLTKSSAKQTTNKPNIARSVQNSEISKKNRNTS